MVEGRGLESQSPLLALPQALGKLLQLVFEQG